MSHESKASESSALPGIVNDNTRHGESCCHEALTNGQPDLNARIEVVTIDRSYQHITNEGKINLEKLLDCSPREHDPPDLQISFSTFLL